MTVHERRESIVNWKLVEDGEYHEQVATIGMHQVTVFSSRDGGEWCYRVDDGDMVTGMETEQYAKREAARDVEALGQEEKA